MNPLRAVIVDDEPLARERLRRLVSSLDNVVIVHECRNGMEAVETLQEREVDLVFLDIQMPELNGFDVIERIGPGRMPAVIFTTAYDEHALRAFEVHALDYLLKPFDGGRLRKAIEHAVETVRGRDVAALRDRLSDLVADARSPSYLERVLVKSHARGYFVRLDDVDWIEADGNYVRLHAGSRAHLLRKTLSAMEEQLDPRKFLRIHRSAIVHVDRIKDLQPLHNGEYEVRLEGDTLLKLTRTYKDRLKRFLAE